MTLLYSAGSYHPWVRKEVYLGLLPKPLVWVHGHQRQHDWDRYPHLGLTQTSLISSYWFRRGPETSPLQWACVLINCILWMLGQTPQSLHRTGPIGKSLLFTCGCPGFWRPLCFCSCLETSPGRTLKLHRHWHSFFSHEQVYNTGSLAYFNYKVIMA